MWIDPLGGVEFPGDGEQLAGRAGRGNEPRCGHRPLHQGVGFSPIGHAGAGAIEDLQVGFDELVIDDVSRDGWISCHGDVPLSDVQPFYVGCANAGIYLGAAGPDSDELPIGREIREHVLLFDRQRVFTSPEREACLRRDLALEAYEAVVRKVVLVLGVLRDLGGGGGPETGEGGG